MMGWPRTGIGTAVEYHCAEPLANNAQTASTHARHNKRTIQRALRELNNRLNEEIRKIMQTPCQGLKNVAGSDAAQVGAGRLGCYDLFRMHKEKLSSVTERIGFENEDTCHNNECSGRSSSMEHRIGDDELHEGDRFELRNAEARCDKSNAGYDVDNELGGYFNADLWVNAEYFNNAGQYDADDEHDAVLVG